MTSVLVLHALHKHAEQLIIQLAGPGQARAAKLALAAAAPQLLGTAEPGSDHQLAWVQLLAWTATAGDQLDLIAGLLAGRTVIPGLLVDKEAAWRLLTGGRAGPETVSAVARGFIQPGAMIEEFLTAAPRDPALIRMLRDHQDAVQRALTSRALPGR